MKKIVFLVLALVSIALVSGVGVLASNEHISVETQIFTGSNGLNNNFSTPNSYYNLNNLELSVLKEMGLKEMEFEEKDSTVEEFRGDSFFMVKVFKFLPGSGKLTPLGDAPICDYPVYDNNQSTISKSMDVRDIESANSTTQSNSSDNLNYPIWRFS